MERESNRFDVAGPARDVRSRRNAGDYRSGARRREIDMELPNAHRDAGFDLTQRDLAVTPADPKIRSS